MNTATCCELKNYTFDGESRKYFFFYVITVQGEEDAISDAFFYCFWHLTFVFCNASILY